MSMCLHICAHILEGVPAFSMYVSQTALSTSMREKWEDSKVNMWPAAWGITEVREDNAMQGNREMDGGMERSLAPTTN